MENNLPIKIIVICIFLMFSVCHIAGSQNLTGIPEPIGSVNELYNYLVSSSGRQKPGQANEKTLKAAPALNLDIIMNSSSVINDANILAGEVKGSKGSTVFFMFKDGAVTGKAVLQNEKRTFKYYSDPNNTVWVVEEDIHKVICIDNPKAKVLSSLTVQAPPPTSGVYRLQSLPGAQAVVYLDFDGQKVVSPYWNGGELIDAAPSNLNEAEIIEAWKLMSEDFRPFILNITTDSTVYHAAPANRRVRCIFTPTTTAYPGSGGVAFIGSFTWGQEVPCWVFNEGGKYAGETGSHEIGHTMGLVHDGANDPFVEYYEGQGEWAPIMGVAYYRPIGHWSKGEYNRANNTEDDIAIIASNNGFGFRADEISNNTAGARPLNYDAAGTLNDNNNGNIEQRTDVDFFTFSTNGGNVTLTFNPAPTHPDLDIEAKIINQSGTVVASSDPTGLSAYINMNLAAGTYYVSINGVGDADPATNGYSDYSSLGLYSIFGKITNATVLNKIPIVSITSPANNATFPEGTNIIINSTASDPDGSVSGVSFYNGNILLGSDASAPYSFTIVNAVGGVYQLKAIATDNKGATGTSSIVNITVTSPNKAPVVNITSPDNGITIAAGTDVTIKANASDPDGTVARVDFYDGNIFLGTDYSAPYSYTFYDIPVDGYYFKAVATDNKGAQTTSVPVSITAVTPGVYGPTCLVPNQTYQYILYTEFPSTDVVWWCNGDATFTPDPANDKITYINFSIWNSGPVKITAGADLATYPWYRQYTLMVNVGKGACGNSVAGVMKTTSNSDDQILVAVENGGKIQTVKVYDANGKEILSSENNNTESVLLSHHFPEGIYIVRAITDEGAYINKIAKIK